MPTITTPQSCSANFYRCIKPRVDINHLELKEVFLGPRPVLEQNSFYSDIQHYRGCLHKQGRRHEVGLIVWRSVEDPDLVFQKIGYSQSPTHSRWLNVVADKLSKLGQTIQTEWSLLPEVFWLICTRWHQVQIDQFVTRFNNKPVQFVSPVCVTRSPGLGTRCTQPFIGGSGSTCITTGSHLG